jgi:hypothetical protein
MVGQVKWLFNSYQFFNPLTHFKKQSGLKLFFAVYQESKKVKKFSTGEKIRWHYHGIVYI